MVLQTLRERLTLVLLAVLPFHAFLVTFGTYLFAGPGHAPLPAFALWKEALLGVILLIAFLEWLKKPWILLDHIDKVIVALFALSVLATVFGHGDLSLYLLGFKYDFVPLVAFFALRRVPWSRTFLDTAFRTLLIVAGVVSAGAIIALYLPPEVFLRVGYSDLHSLYNPDGPLAAFQQIGGTGIRRAQSVMSGPNQLGLWLLIPFGIALVRKQPGAAIFVLAAMFLTLSRSAILGAFVMVAWVLFERLPRKQFLRLGGSLLAAAVILAVLSYGVAPEIVTRAASTRGHITRPLEAAAMMVTGPVFGRGLGTAGPASNRVSDTCVYLEEGADAAWAADRPDLCVFVGEAQVQPAGKACSCPVLPENWYLQMGIEMGMFGFFLFLTLTFFILLRLHPLLEIALPFLGVSVAAFFLHAWEDSAVAYTLWILASVKRQ